MALPSVGFIIWTSLFYSIFPSLGMTSCIYDDPGFPFGFSGRFFLSGILPIMRLICGSLPLFNALRTSPAGTGGGGVVPRRQSELFLRARNTIRRPMLGSLVPALSCGGKQLYRCHSVIDVFPSVQNNY